MWKVFLFWPTRGQFYQHSLCSFYIRKLRIQLFCAYVLGLYFTGARLLAQKLSVERWWNWPQRSLSGCAKYLTGAIFFWAAFRCVSLDFSILKLRCHMFLLMPFLYYIALVFFMINRGFIYFFVNSVIIFQCYCKFWKPHVATYINSPYLLMLTHIQNTGIKSAKIFQQ